MRSNPRPAPVVLFTLLLAAADALAGFAPAAHAGAQQVNLTASSTTLVSSLNPSGQTQPITLTATVVGVPPGATPTGSVTFFVNGAPNSVALAAGVATYSTATLPAGTNTLNASYGGDATYAGSGSSPLAQVVVPSESQLPPELAWGTYGTGAGEIQGAFGIAVNASRMIYVAERSGNRIQEFDPNGNSVLIWGTTGAGNGQFNAPSALAVSLPGNVYVADAGNNRIQRFTGNGAYLGQWGSTGNGNGQFSTPSGVAVDAVGNVYVVDQGNNRVQKFTSTGTFITKWGTLGSGNGQFNLPLDIAVTADGHAYVTDLFNHRVQEFTTTGAYVTQWGGPSAGHGGLSYSRGITVDRDGNVYITEAGCGCVQKFTSSGAYLYQSTPTATFPGLVNPGGPAVDALGNVYATSPGLDQIVKFGHLQRITGITDVGGDQGHQVRIRIAASGADTAGSITAITGYEVYRRIAAGNSPARAQRASRRGQPSPASVQREGWDYVMTVPARGDTSYYAVVPTLADSNASGTHLSTFFVSATTSSPTTNYWSVPDSGYSVDNLPPAPPAPFTAAYAGGATALHWGRNTEADLWYYRVYRGGSAGFVPAPANLVATRSDTGYVDPGAAGGYYALSAVDVNGNESGYATLTPGGTVSVGDGGALTFALVGPRPNPSRGDRLSVEFVLARAVPAHIELLDVSGRLVAMREVGSLGVGRHTVDVAGGRRLAPGMYLVRLSQGREVRTVRAVVLE